MLIQKLKKKRIVCVGGQPLSALQRVKMVLGKSCPLSNPRYKGRFQIDEKCLSMESETTKEEAFVIQDVGRCFTQDPQIRLRQRLWPH
jgi:hypothetical protein